MKTQNILSLFPDELRDFFRKVSLRQEKIQEIRLRTGCPVYVIEEGQERFLDKWGEYTSLPEKAKVLTSEDLKRIVNHICNYSLYAYEDEIRQGFLTVRGGH